MSNREADEGRWYSHSWFAECCFRGMVNSMVSATATAPDEDLLTLEEFADLDIDEPADLVDGKVVLMGNNNPYHSEVLTNVAAKVGNYVKERGLGKVYTGDVTVLVRRGPDTGRAIDLAYVSHETLKNQPEDVSALHVAPELAIEIMSPSNLWEDVQRKVAEYFEIGVRQVWVVSLAVRGVTVFHSDTDIKGYSLKKADCLSCPDILPDFELPLEELFDGLPLLD